MFTLIRNIWNGFQAIVRGVVTVLQYVSSFFTGVWRSFRFFRTIISSFPAGIAALGTLCIVVAVIYLILGR